MEITIYQRLMRILEDKQVSVNALSKMINMSQTTLNNQIKGERALTATVAQKVLEVYPDVSADWVMRGIGEMYSRPSNQTAITANEPLLATDPVQADSESMWKTKYETIKECYDTLVASIGGILGGGMRQSKVNVG